MTGLCAAEEFSQKNPKVHPNVSFKPLMHDLRAIYLLTLLRSASQSVDYGTLIGNVPFPLLYSHFNDFFPGFPPSTS